MVQPMGLVAGSDHDLAGQQFVERLPQIVPRGSAILFETCVVAIIDAAAIAKHELVVENKHGGHGLGLEGIGGAETLVLEEQGRTACTRRPAWQSGPRRRRRCC